ncbi:MAG: ParB/RepB/Spo0J family partition protein [Flavobacteriales bacterium]|nr:ParB/RepB/Spo0J family partition protein [Flavobacteriales bacterium]
MTKKRAALGKGLSALLENANTDITTTKNFGVGEQTVGSISNISIDQIEANPFNPRTDFEEESLNELKESIKVHGIIQPLTVRKLGRDKYQLISGERRFRASQLAGVTEVPCYIRIANDQSMLEMALVENIQRVDLNAIEVGLSYQRLIDECNFTQEKLSKKLGKSRSNITNFLRLLKLPAQIQLGIKQGLISMGHARAIVSAGDEQMQMALFRQVVNEGLSVRELENLLKSNRAAKEKKETPAKAEPSAEFESWQTSLSEQLEAKVKLSANNKGKGKIVISFDSEEDLRRIIELMQ